jgi:hypothetical protein
MKKKRLLILLLISVSGLLTTYIFLKPAYRYLSEYLSKSEQVKANILIVEGWLPDFALEMASENFRKNGYDYIITTGIKSTIEYYEVSSNGYLIFYPKNRFSGIGEYSPHSIEVNAFSSLGGINRAHFNLFVNDSLIADFYAEKRKKMFSAIWKGSLDKIDSIMVQYDNDFWNESGDRNLFVKEISVDHKITIPYLNNSEYAVIKLDRNNRIINNFNSYAELARNKLLSMGIDSTLIIALPGKKVKINRTLTSAFAFRDWLKTTDIEVKGINIISMGTHTRRTWMTYKRILNEKYRIGIVSIPEHNYNNSRIKRFFKTIRETLAIIYYWVILIPY